MANTILLMLQASLPSCKALAAMPTSPSPFLRCHSVLCRCLLLLAACVGCSRDFSTHLNLFPAHKLPPAVVTVNADWSSCLPSARDNHGPAYGACVHLLTDDLLLACGEMPRWRSTVVVYYEPQLTAALVCHRGWCLGLNGLKADPVDPEVIAQVRQRHRR